MVCRLFKDSRGRLSLRVRDARYIMQKGERIMATECNNKGIYPALKGKRRKAAEMIVNPDFDNNISRMCDELKIARSTFYRWLDDADFNGYVNWLIEHYTNSELAAVWKSLIKQAKDGKVEAIKLFFEMKNMYRQQVDLGGGVVFISGEDEIRP